MSVSWRPGSGADGRARVGKRGMATGDQEMSETDVDVPGRSVQSEALVARALALVDAGTTEMADAVLEVPLEYYRDPDLFRREREMVMSTPLGLTTSAQLPEPFDYVVRDVLDTSVLITRGGDGVVRAFLNYCRHRGARPADGCGTARRFTCPYHAWTYDPEGALVGMPGQEGFAGFDRETHGLIELPCEERHGVVWVVATAGAPFDLDAHLGPLGAELEQWDIGSFHFFEERSFDATVNWKAAVEAFAENYHFAYVHGQSIIGMNTLANTATFDRFGRHHRLGFPSPWIVDARGIDDPPVLGSLSLIYWVWPNLILAVTAVGCEVIDLLPGPTSDDCRVRHGLLLNTPVTDETRPGFAELYEAVHAGVRVEDFTMLPSCGDAIRHAQHDHMVIGRNEIGVQNVVARVRRRSGLRGFSAAVGGRRVGPARLAR